MNNHSDIFYSRKKLMCLTRKFNKIENKNTRKYKKAKLRIDNLIDKIIRYFFSSEITEKLFKPTDKIEINCLFMSNFDYNGTQDFTYNIEKYTDNEKNFIFNDKYEKFINDVNVVSETKHIIRFKDYLRFFSRDFVTDENIDLVEEIFGNFVKEYNIVLDQNIDDQFKTLRLKFHNPYVLFLIFKQFIANLEKENKTFRELLETKINTINYNFTNVDKFLFRAYYLMTETICKPLNVDTDIHLLDLDNDNCFEELQDLPIIGFFIKFALDPDFMSNQISDELLSFKENMSDPDGDIVKFNEAMKILTNHIHKEKNKLFLNNIPFGIINDDYNDKIDYDVLREYFETIDENSTDDSIDENSI